MKVLFIGALVGSAVGFLPGNPGRMGTALMSGPDMSKVKAIGGGFPLSTDYLCLFSPEEQGKLQGTSEFLNRVSQGADFTPSSPVNKYYEGRVPDVVSNPVHPALAFLEHLDQDIPTNTISPKSPSTATVIGTGRCTGPSAPGLIQHIVLQVPPGFNYVEGQSLSVIPPGLDPKGRPHKPRLYSIASTRYGDLGDGRTLSLCVRRADSPDGVAPPGVCSGFLAAAAKGDEVSIAGPVGKTMLLPADPALDVIMVATGTGIAPFRGFCHRLFLEATPAAHVYRGRATVYLGVAVSDGLLYKEEFDAMEARGLEVRYAVSREQRNERGGKMYVQDRVREDADDVFNRLENGAVIYFCGLKGMMPGIEEMMKQVCQERGVDYGEWIKGLKKRGQWHVEVY